MSTQMLNFHVSSLFLRLKKSKPISTHGAHLKLLCFFLLFLSPLVAAQPLGLPFPVLPQQFTPPLPPPPPPPPPPPSNQLSLRQSFNPTTAIIMVVLVSAFFVLGFFSIYIRQCLERRLRSSDGGTSYATSGGPGDGPPWSRRVPVGLDASVIDTFPTFLYSDVKGLKIGKGTLECAVCLNEFQDDETLRLIPKCSHVFHPDCIDTWLASHVTCPVCRANLVPLPGDSSFSPFLLLEPDDNHGSVELDGRPDTNDNETLTPGEVRIHVVDESARQPPPGTQSQDANLLYPAHQNRSIRSWSSGWRLREMLFPRSHSTGHSLIQPGDNFDRFTLRLPEEVRSQLLNTTKLNRMKSSVVFSRVRSSRKGYRSVSVGTGMGRTYFNYEQFDHQGQSDRGGFTFTPPSLSRTGSVWSRKGVGVGDDQVGAFPPKKSPRSIESRRMNQMNDTKEDQNGEGSSSPRPTI